MIACVTRGADGKGSNKARKNYQGEVRFDAKKSSKEDEDSVVQISLCTDTGTGSRSERYRATISGRSRECSSVQQSAEKESGELAFYVG